MRACCQNSQKKYINKDRTIDKDVLQSVLKSPIDIVEVPDHELKFYFPREIKNKYKYLIIQDKKEIEICKCACHIKGINLHH